MFPGALVNFLKDFSPLGATVFCAVLLAGIVLSFFWKNFGPWMQLRDAQDTIAACQEQLVACRNDSIKKDMQYALIQAELADFKARYSLVMEALTRSGIAMVIGKPPEIKG